MSTNQNCIELDKIISASQSTNKQARDQATAQIEAFKLDGTTTQVIFEYITTESISYNNRLGVALILKNIIKKIYGQHQFSHYDAALQKRKQDEALTNDEDSPDNFIDQEGLQVLQQHLVSLLMGSTDEKIAALLLECIALMAKRFVQKEWAGLIPELSQYLQGQETQNIKRGLEAIKKICKKYRYMFRSDDLYREMNYMIENLSPILLNNMIMAVTNLQQGQATMDRDQICMCVSMVNSVLHVYESILSQEELPDFYEENLEQITNVCIFVLDTDYAQLAQPADLEKLYKARAKVVRLVQLYQFKFAEFFESKADIFFQKIWEQISMNKITASRQCDRLIQAIVRYIGETSALPNYRDFIKSNIEVLFQVLVLPNISLTPQDIEEYEDEPAQFIKNDLEESDVETRRRNCMKFVSKLSSFFEQEVSNLIGQLIQTLQSEYIQNKEAHWERMATVINLIITASIGTYTYQHGATDIRISPELLESYIQQLIVPELQIVQGVSIDNLSIVKATCIKFVYMFRNQIPDSYVPEFVSLFSEYLKSEQPVNQSYAAACIEKLLIRKQISNPSVNVLNETNMNFDVTSKLLQNICELLGNNQDLYAMRSLLRVVQLSKQGIVPFAGTLGQVLSHFISEATKDSSVSPNYTYILFEIAALTLTYTKQAPEAFAQIENQLTPSLNAIIEQGLTDFVGYAFQLYATFIAFSSQMKSDYETICNSVLDISSIDTNWGKDLKYLIPALGVFITTFMCKYPELAAQKLQSIQHIVSHLLKPDIRMEAVALKICSCVFERLGNAPLQDNGAFMNSVLVSIFTSLHFYRNNTRAKVIPASIMKSIHVFFATIMVCHGSEALVNACNSVQQGILFMVLNSESKSLRHCSNPARDRKYVLVAYSRLMAECAEQMNAEQLQQLTSGLIELASQTTSVSFVSAGMLDRNAEELLIDGAVDQTFAFNRTTFVQLTAAKIEQADQLKTEVTNTNQFVMNCIHETTKKIQQSVSALLLTEKHGSSLQALVEDTGITLS